MTDKTKKIVRIVGVVGLVVSVGSLVSVGLDEDTVQTIVSAVVAAVGLILVVFKK